MNRLETIIFNELASHRAISLPRVGVLRVTRQAARIEGGNVFAPANHVVYSAEADGDIPTVTALGVDEGEYGAWLDGATRDNALYIDGVGTLAMGEFTPSAELAKMLNPGTCAPEKEKAWTPATPAAAHKAHTVHHAAHAEHHAAPTAAHAAHATHHAAAHASSRSNNYTIREYFEQEERRRRKERNIFIFVALVLALLFLLFMISPMFFKSCSWDKEPVALRTHVTVVETPTHNISAVLATPEPLIAPGYYLIIGSYESPAQAEQTAARYRSRYPELNVQTMPNGAGRTRVSVFRGATRREAYNKFFKIAQRTGNWEMWVLEVE